MNLETAVRSSWLGRTRISAKLVAIVAVFVTVICAVTGLFVLAYNIGVGVRAYVGGEGMWSKGQKDAVYSLSRYLGTGSERDYRDYQTAMALPLGDRDARLEMEKQEFERSKVITGFARGGNSEEDIPYMIFLFRYFEELPYFSQAISVWRQAEQQLLQLPPLAEEARKRMTAGPLATAERAAFLDRVQAINAQVTPLEQEFSQLLAAGAREVQALLLKVTLATTAALVAMGALFTWSISRDLRASITGLREGAMRVARGDLSAPIPRRSQDELGELTGVFNDMMVARREAETALITANEFREKVMESATNAIYTMDMEGRFTTANRRTAEITGYPIQDLIGQTWASMVREQDLPDLFAGYVSTVSGLTPITNREIALQQKDGTWVVIVFSIAPLRHDGEIFGVVGVAEDISERKRAEVELKSRAEELARSNQELEQFAYVASHDLQEPLRTVTGFAQLLGRRYQGKIDAEADEFIGFITSGVARMKSLIEDLLAYSRVHREHQPTGVVALDAALAVALANLGAAIHAAGATVTHTALPNLAVDPHQFAQLFQNLIGNAIKFRGAAAPTVHLAAEQREEDWLFSVADNGIGIDAQSAERVFLLFQRVHSRDQYEGNGIGLTICKKIVELHGGRIWVEPTPAGTEGTVFRFTLPRAA